ncbi:MAG: hypothetical protein ACYC2H_12770 [Thermoplasmatota archaeon]
MVLRLFGLKKTATTSRVQARPPSASASFSASPGASEPLVAVRRPVRKPVPAPRPSKVAADRKAKPARRVAPKAAKALKPHGRKKR